MCIFLVSINPKKNYLQETTFENNEQLNKHFKVLIMGLVLCRRFMLGEKNSYILGWPPKVFLFHKKVSHNTLCECKSVLLALSLVIKNWKLWDLADSTQIRSLLLTFGYCWFCLLGVPPIWRLHLCHLSLRSKPLKSSQHLFACLFDHRAFGSSFIYFEIDSSSFMKTRCYTFFYFSYTFLVILF